MKQVFIPTIGHTMTLAQDWQFNLYCESRNDKLIDALYVDFQRLHGRPVYSSIIKHYHGLNYSLNSDMLTIQETKTLTDYGFQNLNPLSRPRWCDCDNVYVRATLPEGTILTIDRIYIRKGKSDYDSISFYAQIPGIAKKKRFWAKREDVNTMMVF